MNDTSTRRCLLRACSAAGPFALAGCFGADDGESDDDTDDASDASDDTDDEEGDGSDDSGDGDTDDPGGENADDPAYPRPVDWTDERRGTVSVSPVRTRVHVPG
jgi:hypothetical protein